MTASRQVWVSGAVEGRVDEAVLQRLVEHVGFNAGPIYGKKGKPHLRDQIRGYNHAARHNIWVVLVDLNDDYPCAPLLLADWLPRPEKQMLLRVAVREIESWLLADRRRLARFLGVPRSRVPALPESVGRPKKLMVDLARHSRRRDIKEDMVPTPQSGRRVGPGYTLRLIEFATDKQKGWRPEAAAEACDSLKRCLKALRAVRTGCDR